MKYCRECGVIVDDEAKYCPECGAPQKDNTPQTIFCRHCGSKIDSDCIICPKCGKQVKDLRVETPSIVINTAVTNQNLNRGTSYGTKTVDKWVSFLLCLFLGYLGAHKFYEGKTGMGIVYLFTAGLFGIGWLFDLVSILLKPNPYYVS
ncbi:MAG TPA: TM2 domain-containing protein [Erysipelotrichaceae bacterium]|jgi:restriction system protein|nr:TM2 domain-containing protein [Erysipelotrichaceae bacterium]